MRVTGGTLRGRTIKMPAGNVRPTQDMVREALFSIIADVIVESRFLDLFAGSGAVGIEALSRGASHVCWVESGKRVLPVLKSNVELLSDGVGEIVRADAVRFLSRGSVGESFDIIFADPPYGSRQKDGGFGVADDLVAALVSGDRLSCGGLFILEQSVADDLTIPSALELVKEKTYGGSRLSFIKKRE